MRAFSVMVLLVSGVLLAACGGDGGDSTGQRSLVAEVVFDPDTLVIEVGREVAVRPALLNARGSGITGPTITYTASGAGLTVDGFGVVRTSTVGFGTITATADGRQGTLVVQVIPIVSQIRIRPSTLTLDVNESAAFIVELLDAQFRPISAPGMRLTWTLSTPSIAEIIGTGIVTGRTVGTTDATVRFGPSSALVRIQVFASTAVSRITPAQPRYGMLVGQTRVFRATVFDANGAPLTRIPTWTTPATHVLQVAADGEATARGAGTYIAEARMGSQVAQTDVIIFDSLRTDGLGTTISDADFVSVGAGSLMRRVGEATTTLTVNAPFRIQRTEVTQAQWQSLGLTLPPNQSRECAQCPVENVTLTLANQFLAALNAAQPGRNYRLPTGAEWEFAARAGETTSDYHDDPELTSWSPVTRSYLGPSRVGLRQPNAFGLYDVHGNVAELTSTPVAGSAGTAPGGAWNTAIFTHAFVWVGPPSSPVTGLRVVRDP